jgi:hypothetical protein
LRSISSRWHVTAGLALTGNPVERGLGFSAVLVLALIAAVVLPTYKIGQYALIQRSVVSSDDAFQGDSAAANGHVP